MTYITHAHTGMYEQEYKTEQTKPKIKYKNKNSTNIDPGVTGIVRSFARGDIVTGRVSGTMAAVSAWTPTSVVTGADGAANRAATSEGLLLLSVDRNTRVAAQKAFLNGERVCTYIRADCYRCRSATPRWFHSAGILTQHSYWL